MYNVVHLMWATSMEETGQSFVFYYNGVSKKGKTLFTKYNTITFPLNHTIRG